MKPSHAAEFPQWLAVVRKTAESLNYGTIEIKIHDGKIVQIETTQKLRLNEQSPRNLSDG